MICVSPLSAKENRLSHIVEIKTQIRDPVAIAAACRRLSLAEPMERNVKLFSSTVSGLAVQLPGWTYPVVCDVASGSLKYDNYNQRWGADRELHKFLQCYAAEKAKLEARKQGHAVTEQTLSDGSLKLTIHVQGGVA
jgi:hypothetical protein